MKVILIGAGCGRQTLTEEAIAAIGQADLIAGASRLLEDLPPYHGILTAEYRPEPLLDLICANRDKSICILLSGDTGFYSGAAGLLERLSEQGIPAAVIPGVSCLPYFASRLGRPWQDWKLCSAHGVDSDPVRAVMDGVPAFFLTSGRTAPGEICSTLTEAGLGALPVTVGENLGTNAERIISETAQTLSGRLFAPLNVLLIEAAPRYAPGVPGIPDEEFLRDKTPMTKQEVRAAALAKLRVSRSDICWDIGAGTGSVSVELALQAKSVWAVERKPDALALAQRNRERFCAWNLHLQEGTAPEALAPFPIPDAVFVGGSGGRLAEILEAVHTANPQARICVSAIALETLHEAMKALAHLGYETEVTQISVSRSRSVGELHLLMAQNPVFLITGVRA